MYTAIWFIGYSDKASCTSQHEVEVYGWPNGYPEDIYAYEEKLIVSFIFGYLLPRRSALGGYSGIINLVHLWDRKRQMRLSVGSNQHRWTYLLHMDTHTPPPPHTHSHSHSHTNAHTTHTNKFTWTYTHQQQALQEEDIFSSHLEHPPQGAKFPLLRDILFVRCVRLCKKSFQVSILVRC